MFFEDALVYALLALIPISLGVIALVFVYSGRFIHLGRRVRLSTLIFSFWVIASIILTPYTFALRLPGLPDMSIERLLFFALVAGALFRAYARDCNKGQNVFIEFFMILYCLWCVGSMARFGFIETYPGFARPSYMFMVGYLLPFFAFVYVKKFMVDVEDYDVMFKCIFFFGAYLSILAFLEKLELKSFVYPQYIVDTTISEMHLDRSRGPFLNAAFNGLALNITFICGLMALPAARKDRRWLYYLVLLLHIPAIYFTRTRSVYVQFLMTVMVMLSIYDTRIARWKFFPAMILAVAVLLGANWSKLTSSDREAGGIGQMKEISIRLELAEKSLNSILEHPFGGVGLAQFRTASLFTPSEVEFQHNQLIGMAVELGLPGMLLYLMIYFLTFSRLYRLCATVPDGVFVNLNLVILLATALFGNMLNNFFVEPSLHLFANLNFFIFAGVADNLYSKYCMHTTVHQPLGVVHN